MAGFVGRAGELALLTAELDRVRGVGDRPGRCMLVRGRRRVGKSRLVEEFVERSGVASLYFTAAGLDPAAEIRRLCSDAADSTLPGRDLQVSTGLSAQVKSRHLARSRTAVYD